MPNMHVQAAAEGLPQINRRSFLLNAAAAGAVTATAAVPATEAAAEPQANPELVALFRDLKEAMAEKAAATDAKEWIVDEWRHRWPLAPDEITLPGIGGSCDGEVDLAGRPIIRPGEKCARRVRDLENLAWLSENMAASAKKARTEKDRARRQAAAARDKRNLHLGEAYYSEMERVKEASGIRPANARIKAAHREINRLSEEIMALPTSSLSCLAIKAEAVEIWCETTGYLLKDDHGIFGWSCRLARDILNVVKGGEA